MDPRTAGALCRLARGLPPLPAEGELEALEGAGLVECAGELECRSAARYAELGEERERLLGHLNEIGVPRGLGALVPGARARARQRAAETQASLDLLDENCRKIERAYRAGERDRWPLHPLAALLPRGGRVLVTPAGVRSACECWCGPRLLPTPEALARLLEESAARAAAVAGRAGNWRRAGAETLWVSAVLVARLPSRSARAGFETLRALHEWLERQELWGEDPLPAAAILASAGTFPSAAGRAAADLYEALRGDGFGADAGTFAAACRLAARPAWMSRATQRAHLGRLVLRVQEMRLASLHRVLPVLAPLAWLPRPVAEVGESLRAFHHGLRRRSPSAASTLEVAAALLAGSGLHHAARQEGQDLFHSDDAVLEQLLHRYLELRGRLPALDGGEGRQGGRAEVLCAAAALLPGPPEGIAGCLAAAHEALRAAGAPPGACRLPAAIALCGAAYGLGVGADPADVGWELLRVDEIVDAAWKIPPAPERAPGPSL